MHTALQIASVSPPNGKPGDNIKLLGIGFGLLTGNVMISNVNGSTNTSCDVTFWNDKWIAVQIPGMQTTFHVMLGVCVMVCIEL